MDELSIVQEVQEEVVSISSDVKEGMLSHPIVLPFWEEHKGKKQQTLMRVISKHITALDRQVSKSVNIIGAGNIPEDCLNSKNEWGGPRFP